MIESVVRFSDANWRETLVFVFTADAMEGDHEADMRRKLFTMFGHLPLILNQFPVQ